MDAQAERWYRQGVESGDRASLRRVVDLAFCSSWGDEALESLGDLAFQDGRYGEAIAAYLGVTPSHFYEGIEGGTEPVARPGANGGAYRDEFLALSEAFAAIANAQTRASVLALVRSLAMAPRQHVS